MKSAVRAALFLVVLFLIPIVPYLWLGESFEQSLLQALRAPSSPSVVSGWVIGLLAADMFLPVPSSAVITYAGGVLGIASATLVSWIGLSAGSMVGFALARLFGEPLARWLSEPQDLERMNSFVRRHGTMAMIVTRALPILAEACVLLLGAARVSWRRFVPPLLITNALLALTYAACGAYFRDSAAFPIVIVVSGAVPLLAALGIRRCGDQRKKMGATGPKPP